MDLKKKSKRRVVKDRISALPDALVCHILSFLETKKAVSTSVLSRRWKNLWKSVPILDLDMLDMLDFDEEELKIKEACADFGTFVDGVLSSRDNSLDIQSFRLGFYLSNDNRDQIDGWIQTAIRHNAVKLDLYVENEDSNLFQLPKCVFTSKTLEHLKLKSLDYIIYRPPTSGCFPSLKFLHIEASPNQESMENLFSQCPVLEDLTLDLDETRLKNLNICAPKLKRLRVDMITNIFVNYSCNLFVNAPELENLHLHIDDLLNCPLENAKSIVEADIAVLFCEEKEGPALFNPVNALLTQISRVKYLSLSAPCFEACDLPAFDSLNKLKLALHCYNWEFLGVILKISPNLEDLVLDYETLSFKECREHQWNPPEFVPICLSSHLKTISIKAFKGGRVEMEVAEYLLKNGRSLNKMTILTGGVLYTEEKELYKEFLMFQRGSTACQVEFTKRRIY